MESAHLQAACHPNASSPRLACEMNQLLHCHKGEIPPQWREVKGQPVGERTRTYSGLLAPCLQGGGGGGGDSVMVVTQQHISLLLSEMEKPGVAYRQPCNWARRKLASLMFGLPSVSPWSRDLPLSVFHGQDEKGKGEPQRLEVACAN